MKLPWITLAILLITPAASAENHAPGASPSTPQAAKSSRRDPNAMLGVDKNGYWENKEKLEELKRTNPGLYQIVRKRGDEVKKRAEEQMAREGANFKGMTPDPRTAQGLEEAKAAKKKGGSAKSSAAAPEPVISGKGIAKEMRFKGSGSKDKDKRAPSSANKPDQAPH